MAELQARPTRVGLGTTPQSEAALLRLQAHARARRPRRPLSGAAPPCQAWRRRCDLPPLGRRAPPPPKASALSASFLRPAAGLRRRAWRGCRPARPRRSGPRCACACSAAARLPLPPRGVRARPPPPRRPPDGLARRPLTRCSGWLHSAVSAVRGGALGHAHRGPRGPHSRSMEPERAPAARAGGGDESPDSHMSSPWGTDVSDDDGSDEDEPRGGRLPSASSLSAAAAARSPFPAPGPSPGPGAAPARSTPVLAGPAAAAPVVPGPAAAQGTMLEPGAGAPRSAHPPAAPAAPPGPAQGEPGQRPDPDPAAAGAGGGAQLGGAADRPAAGPGPEPLAGAAAPRPGEPARAAVADAPAVASPRAGAPAASPPRTGLINCD